MSFSVFRDLKGENNAKEISDALPFVEYEIHRQLINKLKMKGESQILYIHCIAIKSIEPWNIDDLINYQYIYFFRNECIIWFENKIVDK